MAGGFNVSLLHGVTGSGKTEVYLQAIRAAQTRGCTAIVLVPEISLTPQTVERFKGRFAEGLRIALTKWGTTTTIALYGEWDLASGPAAAHPI